MTSPTIITAGPGSTSGTTDTARAAEVYTVAPGYHVSFLAGAPDPATPFDLIEVVAALLVTSPSGLNTPRPASAVDKQTANRSEQRHRAARYAREL
jgi:hypothetical protein